MPATAGRVRMPHNNRVSTSGALKTSDIWSKTIGHDPYAAQEDPAAAASAAADAEKARGLLELARHQNVAGGAKGSADDFARKMFLGLKGGKRRRAGAEGGTEGVARPGDESSSSEEEFVEAVGVEERKGAEADLGQEQEPRDMEKSGKRDAGRRKRGKKKRRRRKRSSFSSSDSDSESDSDSSDGSSRQKRKRRHRRRKDERRKKRRKRDRRRNDYSSDSLSSSSSSRRRRRKKREKDNRGSRHHRDGKRRGEKESHGSRDDSGRDA